MNRPWQIWLAFVVCAAVAFAAMGWLTMQMLDVDRQLVAAQAEADLEQQISIALWRMDTKLAPLIAEEVARPPSFFSFWQFLTNEDPLAWQQPLPTIPSARDNVFLNFEVTAEGQWNSPQVPETGQEKLANQYGMSPAEITKRQLEFSFLCQQVPVEELIAKLPEQPLPQAQALPTQQTEPSYFIANSAPSKISKSQQTKDGNYLQARSKRYQDIAQQELQKQRGGYGEEYGQQTESATFDKFSNILDRANNTPIVENVSRPVWVGENLLLARRVMRGEKISVQGSWLDWPNIKAELLTETEGEIPGADLVPVHDLETAEPEHMLAGLPVQLVVAPAPIVSSTSEPIRWALRVGWGGLLVAVAAVSLLLWGVIALSERRAAFVSSVTHELRTPLTTFRMYSDMLARGMVPNAERKQEYLETLHSEAQRLSHLVENVLSYARLERGRGLSSREQLSAKDLISRLETRLSERAAQAEMELNIEISDEAGQYQLTTDVSIVEQILFNLVDNAAKYAVSATDRRIHCKVYAEGDYVTFSVRDHGPGFEKTRRANKPRPFSKSSEEAAVTAPGVGLGLALCGRLAKQLGGKLDIAGNEQGAIVKLFLPLMG